jgi:hypothetical protein
MKTHAHFFGMIIGAAFIASTSTTAGTGSWGRHASANRTVSPSHDLSKSNRARTMAYRVPDEVGPNSRTWKGNGGHGAVTEIGTGMNFFDGQRWIPSDAKFEATPDSFIANKVQHKIRLRRQLNLQGSVQVTTPDGLVLKSTPVAIQLYDAASGKATFVAFIQDTVGEWVGPNQVIYKNAFNENGISADVLYTLEKGTFEQDVIITGRLKVTEYGFPTETTRLRGSPRGS